MDEVLLHLVAADNRAETDHRIRAYLQAKLRVSPQVKYISAADMQKLQFPEGVRKPVKFIDRR
jgi:phenylacetate-CoA ligase